MQTALKGPRLLAFLCALLVANATATLHAQRQPSANPQQTAIIQELRRATVTLVVERDGARSGGSGFILSPEGIIATAAHVIEGASSAVVRLAAGDEYPVQGVLFEDPDRDLALIRIAGFGLPTARLGNSDSVEVGQRVMAVGAPLGLETSVTDGIVSALRLNEGSRVFQLSVPVSPGSSGGPVATADGRVIGVVRSKIIAAGAENLSFSVPINYLRGQIAIAGERVPTPLGRTSASRRFRSDSVRLIAGAPQLLSLSEVDSLPDSVNMSPRRNWRRLAGVRLYERVIDGRLHWARITEYRLATDPYGRETFEVTTSDSARQTSALGARSGPESLRESRTVIRLDSIGRIDLLRRRSHEGGGMSGRRLSIVRNRATLDDDSATRVSRSVPIGVYPSEALTAAIAALPDSLPSTVFVWVVHDTPGSMQVVPIRLVFGASQLRNIPAPPTGKRCGGTDFRAINTSVYTRQVTITYGPTQWEGWVLAQSPHLVITEELVCAELPPATSSSRRTVPQ